MSISSRMRLDYFLLKYNIDINNLTGEELLFVLQKIYLDLPITEYKADGTIKDKGKSRTRFMTDFLKIENPLITEQIAPAPKKRFQRTKKKQKRKRS